ncbi:hypothetical protein BC628DRAFT_125897 [Trametes gibbosa]|nr:hypothetical protein BC628DRAFT_125897 [Trametes gibbosa]
MSCSISVMRPRQYRIAITSPESRTSTRYHLCGSCEIRKTRADPRSPYVQGGIAELAVCTVPVGQVAPASAEACAARAKMHADLARGSTVYWHWHWQSKLKLKAPSTKYCCTSSHPGAAPPSSLRARHTVTRRTEPSLAPPPLPAAWPPVHVRTTRLTRPVVGGRRGRTVT